VAVVRFGTVTLESVVSNYSVNRKVINRNGASHPRRDIPVVIDFYDDV
jgi:hypothetical protein